VSPRSLGKRRIVAQVAPLALLAAAAGPLVHAAAQAPSAVLAPLDGQQVVTLLDQTIDWYRAQGTARSLATRPGELLFVSEDRQATRQIIGLAFAIARTDAELLAKGAKSPAAAGAAASPANGLIRLKKKLSADEKSIDAEMASARESLARARGKQAAALRSKISELQGERDLADARISILDTMAAFIDTNDSFGTGPNALKMRIEAMALALPGAGSAAATAAPLAEPAADGAAAAGGGLWHLAANVLRLANKERSIGALDRGTAALQDAFTRVRAPLISRVKTLAVRGDALAAEADTADTATLGAMRPQLDALAGQFKQISVLLIPLSKAEVLFRQYRANLGSWRAAVERQYREALTALGVRIGVLIVLLVMVFTAAEFWRRAVIRYVHDLRRRHQLLLLRNITLWSLVAIIIGFSFASEIGSIATFAGLITAGVAVAMQSVLVSIVGYFFLIGKYGVRVGDRVQIGDVTGEVIHLGLVRLHLLELGAQGKLGPTGRVVAFANSIVFQASGGLFKQITGVNMAWHEIKLTLPAGVDPAAAKNLLLAAVNGALADYRGEIDRQAGEINKATAFQSGGGAEPQVQLQFSASAVEALVRYPVHLSQAAEIDERVSKELIRAIGRQDADGASSRGER